MGTMRTSPLAPVHSCPGRDDPGVVRFLRAAARALGASTVVLDLEVDGAPRPRRYTLGDGVPGSRLELAAPDRFRAVLLHDGRGPESLVELLLLALEHVLESRWLEHQVELTREVLDVTSSAIFLFDGSGEIVYTNPPGDRLLERQTSAALEIEADGRRRPLLTHICELVERLGRDPSRPRAAGRHTLPDGTQLCWEVVPLPGAVGGGSPTLAVVRQLEARPIAALDRVTRRFGLTRREREVLSELTCTESTTDIARALGISVHTVRDHLKRIYRKTGCRSRRELVRLVETASPDATG